MCTELVKYGMDDPAIGDEYEMYRVADVNKYVAELKAKVDELQRTNQILNQYKLMAHSSYGIGSTQRSELKETKHAMWTARALRNRDLRTLGNFRKYVESLVKTQPSIYYYPTQGLPGNQLHKRMMYAFETWCKYLKIAEDKCLKKAKEYE